MSDVSETQHDTIRSFRDLVAWQKAMALARRVYGAVRLLPDVERYGLSQQLRRAAVSVPSNIAEGWGRGAGKDCLRFLRIARGSLCEMLTQILLARDMEYLTHDQAQSLLDDAETCSKVLYGLMKGMKGKRNEDS